MNLGQVALGELPVVLFAVEDVGQGQEHALLGTVLVQRESGDTDDVHGGVAAQDVGQDVFFRSHHAAALQVNEDLAAGQLFEFRFESPGHVADDGAAFVVLFQGRGNGVHFSIGQGNRIRESGRAAQDQGQGEQDTKQFLHGDASLFNYG